MSAVFRKGGDVNFLVEELKAVFDPRGGYWQSGGTFMPSIIAELGHIIEKHLTGIGLLKVKLTPAEEELIEKKKQELQSAQSNDSAKTATLPGAKMCDKCSSVSAVMMDGCLTCLTCGYSKCG
jgi:hypothetical protein